MSMKGAQDWRLRLKDGWLRLDEAGFTVLDTAPWDDSPEDVLRAIETFFVRVGHPVDLLRAVATMKATEMIRGDGLDVSDPAKILRELADSVHFHRQRVESALTAVEQCADPLAAQQLGQGHLIALLGDPGVLIDWATHRLAHLRLGTADIRWTAVWDFPEHDPAGTPPEPAPIAPRRRCRAARLVPSPKV